MGHVKLFRPFHNCEPGDVIHVSAVVARDLKNKGIGYGGAIDTSTVKEVDYSVATPEGDFEEGVETVQPKPLDGTKKEIKKWLDDHDVDYPSSALKDELLEILEDV